MQTQWGITNGPRESDEQRCRRGCEMDSTDESYECVAKGCMQHGLCEGCTYHCAKCDEDFCFDHVLDVNPKEDPATLYLCVGCAAKVAAVACEKLIAAAKVAA